MIKLGIFLLVLGYITTILTINMLIMARKITGYESYEDLTVIQNRIK